MSSVKSAKIYVEKRQSTRFETGQMTHFRARQSTFPATSKKIRYEARPIGHYESRIVGGRTFFVKQTSRGHCHVWLE